MIAVVFWNEHLHALDHIVNISMCGKGNDVGDIVAHGVEVVGTHFRHHNFIVFSGVECFLLIVEQFLVEFFARTKTDFLDFDIHTWAQTCERNHASSQIVNLHWFTHVEHIDFTTVTHTASLKHKATSLWNGHEVANDVAVSDGDRSTLCNLSAENRNHRAVAAEHIAKASGDELGFLTLALCIEEE